MSLKAKLEAVIYAAEEPVTLAQLAVLFAGEALEWKAARDAEEAPALPLPEEASIEETLEKQQMPSAESEPSAPEPDIERAPAEAAEEEASPASTEAIAEPVVENAELAAAVNAEEAELEARRQERKRERDAREVLRSLLDELIAEYEADTRGVEIREIAGGYRMGTKPEMHDAVRAFVKSLKPPLKLSLPALETLAVIAYKQPVTAPEVGEIRGVDSAGVLGSLMSRKLVATAGRKQVVGRPMLYKTTKEFLLRFGLKDLNELPSMEEFEKMAAQELSEDTIDEGEAQSGDLFAESETATVPNSGEEGVESAETQSAGNESAAETTTEDAEAKASAEPVTESAPAESQAVTEWETSTNEATGGKPDAEEIEVES
jgi:segregation and condensation protein B